MLGIVVFDRIRTESSSWSKPPDSAVLGNVPRVRLRISLVAISHWGERSISTGRVARIWTRHSRVRMFVDGNIAEAALDWWLVAVTMVDMNAMCCACVGASPICRRLDGHIPHVLPSIQARLEATD